MDWIVTVESAMHVLMCQLIARLVDAYRTEDKLKGTDPQTFLLPRFQNHFEKKNSHEYPSEHLLPSLLLNSRTDERKETLWNSFGT